MYKRQMDEIDVPTQLPVPSSHCRPAVRPLACTGAHMQYACAECGIGVPEVDADRLMRCARCRLVRYCSKECQVAGWERSHRSTCGVYSDWPTDKGLQEATVEQLVCAIVEWGPRHPVVVLCACPRIVRDGLPGLSPRRMKQLLEALAVATAAFVGDFYDRQAPVAWVTIMNTIMAWDEWDETVASTSFPLALLRRFAAVGDRVFEHFLDGRLDERGVFVSRSNYSRWSFIEVAANVLTVRSDLRAHGEDDGWRAACRDVVEAASRCMVAIANMPLHVRRVALDLDMETVGEDGSEGSGARRGSGENGMPILVRVLQNATYTGVDVCLASIVRAYDACDASALCMGDVEFGLWVKTCRNLSGRCGIDASVLQRKLEATARRRLQRRWSYRSDCPQAGM
mgnify:CR=1 FL=1